MKNTPRRLRRFLLFFAPLLLCALAGHLPLLYAQDMEEARGGDGFFYFEKSGDELRFIQHISWEKQDYAYRYEVTIEKQTDGGFLPAAADFTTENFIEVSLTAGRYRYRVVVYDLFDTPGDASAWTEFAVLPALPPRISAFRPEAFWLDEEMKWVLFLEGQNFTKEAEVSLRPREAAGEILPLEYIPEPSGKSARLVFDKRALKPGLYDVYIKNPGGLETLLGTFIIGYRGLFDINISLGYGPLIPLYGDLNSFFDKPVFPLGAAARLSIVPLKRDWGSLGLELAPFWTSLSTSGDGYEASARYIGGHANALLQKWIQSRIMAFNFRLGAGLVLLDDLHFEFPAETTPPLQTLMPSLGAGVSFLWFLSGPLFIELGGEYLHFFSVDTNSPGYFRPILGGGCRF